ncbi:hypothetical protein [Accumulibacter sp.]|uniref:hypothetical protein n=1 Tax=Accumulibacter sp. TaxID=2053492 RepID=UPI00257FBFD6|nr:hypothetical protein [Accumulibacter sp.]
MTLKETPGCLTVPELKDLVGYLRGGASSARKDDLIERILVAMLGSELETAWTLLDETQQAAVAEAAHHPLGEYSDWRFRAKYQRAPAFQVAAAKSYGYSAGKRTAWCLFIQYAPDEGRHVPTDLRPPCRRSCRPLHRQLKALGMPPAQVLRGLWQKWLKTTLFDEFSRVDEARIRWPLSKEATTSPNLRAFSKAPVARRCPSRSNRSSRSASTTARR